MDLKTKERILKAVESLNQKYGLHLDAKQVLRKISGKRPGKHCVGKSGKGSYISAEKKCAGHKTADGKLTESGKISARELASKVRKRKGMSDRNTQKEEPLKVVKKTRGEVLQASLEKKLAKYKDLESRHIADVRSANGQPLNDKRNGQATMNRWKKQRTAMANQDKEIAKTERAIEDEQWKVRGVAEANKGVPSSISRMVEDGGLTQWRKYPNRFFIPDVDKARIIWDPEKQELSHSYTRSITDKDQQVKFLETWKQLKKDLESELQKPKAEPALKVESKESKPDRTEWATSGDLKGFRIGNSQYMAIPLNGGKNSRLWNVVDLSDPKTPVFLKGQGRQVFMETAKEFLEQMATAEAEGRKEPKK